MPRTKVSDRIEAAIRAPGAVTPIVRGRDAFSAQGASAVVGEPRQIATALIDPAPHNPRTSLGDVGELAASIRELGIISPVLVTPDGERFRLVYGHRRLAAAIEAGLEAVPAILSTDTDERTIAAKRLTENIQREDLSPLEEGAAFAALLELGVEGGQRGLAKMLGKSQAHVSKRLGLLRLPDAVRSQVDSGTINLADAMELTKLADDPELVEKAVKAAASGYGEMSVVVARELRAIQESGQREAAAEVARAAGVRVIDEPASYSRQHGPYALAYLSIELADVDHAALDCHAVVIPSYGSRVLEVCLNPAAHLGANQEAQAQRRTDQAELEAAETTSTTTRRSFASTLVRNGNPAAGAALAVAQLRGNTYRQLWHYEEAVAELLGLRHDTEDAEAPADAIMAYSAKGPRNTQRVIYALALALGEQTMSRFAHKAYLDHLVANGYTLSPVELELLDDEEDNDNRDQDNTEDAAP